MTNPQEKSHRTVVQLRPDEPLDLPANAVCDLEFASLCALITSGAEELMRPRVDAWARELAEPFGADNARACHIARDVAVLRMRISLNERRRDEVIGAGDVALAMAVDRLIQTDGRRLEGLYRSLREEQRGGARTVRIGAVTIGDRAEVHVLAANGVRPLVGAQEGARGLFDPGQVRVSRHAGPSEVASQEAAHALPR